jgi:hypothetical protein
MAWKRKRHLKIEGKRRCNGINGIDRHYQQQYQN